MDCILASIFERFWWILGGKLGSKIEQKSIPKGIEKVMKKRRSTWGVLGASWARLGPFQGWRGPRRAALLGPGYPPISLKKGTLQNSTDHLPLDPDTQLGSFGPGADPKRSKAAYPPPRCVLDHRLNGSKFEEAGWTANSPKKSSKNLPKWTQNEGF